MSMGKTVETNNIYVAKTLARYASEGNFNFIKVMEYNKYSEYDFKDFGILVWVKIPTRGDFVIIAKYDYCNNEMYDWFQDNEASLDFSSATNTANSLCILNKAISTSGYAKDLNLASLKARLRMNSGDFHFAIRALVYNYTEDFRTLRKNGWNISRYNRGKCTIASLTIKEQNIVICSGYGVLHFVSIDGVKFYTEWSHYSRTSVKYTNLAGGNVSAAKTAFGGYDYIPHTLMAFAE